MTYLVGDGVRIEGLPYMLIGSMRLSSKQNGKTSYWMEYRLRKQGSYDEVWLTVDLGAENYRLYKSCPRKKGNFDDTEWSLLEDGQEVVDLVNGNIEDTLEGEKAFYQEYKSLEGEIYSIEDWGDGSDEYSLGRSIDKSLIVQDDTIPWPEDAYMNVEKEEIDDSDKPAIVRIWRQVKPYLMSLLILAFTLLMFIDIPEKPKTIDSYLKGNSHYTYVTSITGDNHTYAHVYESSQSVDATAQAIIDGVKGQVKNASKNQSDLSDESIALLTDKEYCFIYKGTNTNKTLVRVESRDYAYGSNDSSGYHTSNQAQSYYRYYYWRYGYGEDKERYQKPSRYDSYSPGKAQFVEDKTYDSYAQSIRQNSTGVRSSSGGGVSSGGK